MSNLFHIICNGSASPSGWGFPLPPRLVDEYEESETAASLREALFPFSGEEGFAQMVRFYAPLLRSRFEVSVRLRGASLSSYQPSMAWKAPVEFGSRSPRPSAVNGILRLGWIPSGETDALHGQLEFVATKQLRLRLGSFSETVNYEMSSDEVRVDWPTFLRLDASFRVSPGELQEGWKEVITLRPYSFNTTWLKTRIEQRVTSSAFLGAGLWDQWVSADDDTVRVALAWALLHHHQTPRNA